MKWRTQYDERLEIHSNSGTEEHILYQPQFDKEGNYELVESGRENLYDFIQSHAESCDIHVILERFARGDESALSRVQGVYADVTGMPGSYAEMLNTVIAGEQQFNSLPLEVREKFDHSFQKWLITMDDMPKWLNLMGYENPSSTLNNTEPPTPAAPEPSVGSASASEV